MPPEPVDETPTTDDPKVTPPADSPSIDINVKKGKSTKDMEGFTSLRMPTKEGKANAAEIRAKLEKRMSSSDRFLNSDGFPLEKSTENDTDYEHLLVAENGSAKFIRIVTKQENTKEKVKLQQWPTDATFWKSDIMNDIALPPTGTNPVAAPSNTKGSAAALEKFLDFNSFGVLEWATLIKSNNLISGVRMDDDKGPRPSAYPLVQAPPSLDDFRTYRNPSAYVYSETCYSERTSKYNRQAWGKLAVQAASPFVSGAIEGEHRQTSGSNVTQKTIYTTASYRYPFCTVILDPATMETTSDFKERINEAMNHKEQNAKLEALKKVFSLYGHSFATEVTLGAELVTTGTTKTSAKMTQYQFENKVRAQVVGASPMYSGSITGAGGWGREESDKSVDQSEKLTITARGGNTLLASNAKEWVMSVADYRTWRVIDVVSAVPITEFIEQNHRAEVQALAQKFSSQLPSSKPLRGKWVEPILHKSNAKGGAKAWFRTYRPVPGDGWFWLGQTLDSGRALIVKENSPDANALGGVQLATMVHSNTAGGEATNSNDDESFWKLHASDPNYMCLGDYYQSNVSFRGEYTPPNIDGDEVLKTIRSVRKDLLVGGEIADNPVWTNDGEVRTQRGAVWLIKDGSCGAVKTVDPGLFKAHAIDFRYVLEGGSFLNLKRPSDRSCVKNPKMLLLKESAIDIDPLDPGLGPSYLPSGAAKSATLFTNSGVDKPAMHILSDFDVLF